VPRRQPTAARVGGGLVGKYRLAAGQGSAYERVQVAELQSLGSRFGQQGLAGCIPSNVGDGANLEIGRTVGGVKHIADKAKSAGAKRQQALKRGGKYAATLRWVEQVQGRNVELREPVQLGLQLGLCQVGQIAQGSALCGAELARAAVDDAQRAHGVSAIDHQGGAGVEADARLIPNEWVLSEARVQQGIGDFKNVRPQDGVAAKRDGPIGLRDFQPLARLDPLAFGVDQRDQRDRHIEQGLRQPGEAIEAIFGGGVEHPQRAQGAQARSFVTGHSGSANIGADGVHALSGLGFRFGKWRSFQAILQWGAARRLI